MTDLTWRRSARCETHNCVEVAWRKSSRSEAHFNCVEVGATAEAALVRDSKLGGRSPILAFTPSAWASFLSGIRAGEFDLP